MKTWVITCSALALAAFAVPGLADPIATSNVWSALGATPGKSAPAPKTGGTPVGGAGYSITLVAWATKATSEVTGQTGGTNPDYSGSQKTSTKTSYQLEVGHSSAYGCTWGTHSSAQWTGAAQVSTVGDGDAKVGAAAALRYTGDNALYAAAVTAASTAGSGDMQINWALEPSLTQTIKKGWNLDEDEDEGNTSDTQSGAGHKVRVDVFAMASGEIFLDTNLVGLGYAGATADASIDGTLKMWIILVPGGVEGGGGPTTPGGETSGPITGGKRFEINVKSTGPLVGVPEAAEGEEFGEVQGGDEPGGIPEFPKDLDDPDPVNADDEGKTWGNGG